MDFEQDLRRALRREPAPPGFAERLIAQIEQANAPLGHPAPRRHRPASWLAAVAAALVLAVAGTQYYAHRQTIAEGERARRDVMLALQIAADKFGLVKARLDEHEKGRPEEVR